MFYADTSALVKLVVVEAESRLLRDWIVDVGPKLSANQLPDAADGIAGAVPRWRPEPGDFRVAGAGWVHRAGRPGPVRWSGFVEDDVGHECVGEVCQRDSLRSDAPDEVGRAVLVEIEPGAVNFQEDECGFPGETLVAIFERLSLGDAEREPRSLLCQARERLDIAEPAERRVDRRFQDIAADQYARRDVLVVQIEAVLKTQPLGHRDRRSMVCDHCRAIRAPRRSTSALSWVSGSTRRRRGPSPFMAWVLYSRIMLVRLMGLAL